MLFLVSLLLSSAVCTLCSLVSKTNISSKFFRFLPRTTEEWVIWRLELRLLIRAFISIILAPSWIYVLRKLQIPQPFYFHAVLRFPDSSCLVKTVQQHKRFSAEVWKKKRHLQVDKSTLIYILINFFISGNDGFPQIALLLISLWKFVEEIPNSIFFKQHKMHFLI